MNGSAFWSRMSDEYLKEHPEPPPLTDASLAAFEQRIGLKLPKVLADLLRIQNGGPLRNTDFRFNGRDYQVTYIKAATPVDSYDSIRAYSTILEGDFPAESRKALEAGAGNLSRILLVAEPLDYHYAFALNYNRLNRDGEPTVWWILLEFDEAPKFTQVADSFAAFLGGRYFGDENPIVDLEEARAYRVIASGEYHGRYRGEHVAGSGLLAGLPVHVRWKICAAEGRLVIFQEIDWGGDMRIKREEMEKSALAFDFSSLESHGLDVEPELAELIRPAIEIEIISKYGADLVPDCYQLLLPIEPSGDSLVSVKESQQYQGRWKNSESQVVYSSIMSASKAELEQVLRAVAGD